MVKMKPHYKCKVGFDFYRGIAMRQTKIRFKLTGILSTLHSQHTLASADRLGWCGLFCSAALLFDRQQRAVDHEPVCFSH